MSVKWCAFTLVWLTADIPLPSGRHGKDASLYNEQSQWSDLSLDLWNNYKAVDWLNTDHFGTQNSTTTNYLAVIYFSFKFRSAF